MTTPESYCTSEALLAIERLTVNKPTPLFAAQAISIAIACIAQLEARVRRSVINTQLYCPKCNGHLQARQIPITGAPMVRITCASCSWTGGGLLLTNHIGDWMR